MVYIYKLYILQIGDLYITYLYHLLREPGNSIEYMEPVGWILKMMGPKIIATLEHKLDRTWNEAKPTNKPKRTSKELNTSIDITVRIMFSNVGPCRHAFWDSFWVCLQVFPGSPRLLKFIVPNLGWLKFPTKTIVDLVKFPVLLMVGHLDF